MTHRPPRAASSQRAVRHAAALATPLALVAGALAAAPPAAAATDLYFSEYVEGSSNNKALEIYNGTGAAVDISQYSVQVYFNGATTANLTIPLSGSVASGDVFVLAQSSAVQEILDEADQTNGAGWFNGDDAVALVRDGTTLDVIGQIGVDPGSEWGSGLTSTADNTLRRKASVDGGDPDGSDPFDPAVQWDGYETNTFDGLGSHDAGPVEGGPPALTCEATVSTRTGEAASSEVSATDADNGVDTLAITSDPVAGITLEGSTAPSAAGEAATATLAVAGTTAVGTYDVVVTATADDGEQATCTVTVEVLAPLTTSLVSTVQGSGDASPLVGQEVQVEAVVTSLITSRDVLDGFFVQEEDADADGDPATSEGVYVFCRALCPADLAAGDLVQVVGTVAEFNDSTQVDATAGSIEVLDSGLPLPSAATVTLPASGSTADPATFEAVEGMVTTITTTLAVSEYFELARFGSIVLTADEREYQYTQTDTPTVEGYEAFLADLATRRIVLDDDSNDQNDATSGPLDNEPYYYPTPGFSTENYVRGGDTVTGLTGVMEYSFGEWKLRPVPGLDYTFERANPRPAEPDEVGGRLTVASFNVLNYFATVDDTASGSSGPCGPSGTDDCRGADSEDERERQLAKIVAALTEIDADVFGLIEIQNDEGEATQQIVDALNAATAPGTYDYVDTGFIGTDAIKQAFLYKTATVAPVGDYALLTQADDERFRDDRNRPALIQTFEEVATGEVLTVAVNHFKSKGSGCGAGDDSPEDGSGNCDLTRTLAAQALADYLATDPTGSGDPDYLVIGDLNSYSQERPITTLEAAGYVDLLERYQGLESYGYVFDGLLGHLDHALATPSLAEQVTGAGGWLINADEVPLLDYNDTVLDTGEQSFERESTALPLYEPNAYRSSDHDPVVVGISLDSAPVADAGGPYTVKPGSRVRLDASASYDLEGEDITFEWDLDGDGQFDDATGPVAYFRANRSPGDYPVAVRVSDADESTVDETAVSVIPPGLQRP
ncbi:ExeM/NucH family extracellular endonuclease [Aquipuribacter sp. SD81]|uniref:ExeM/NucH family extracellular endonuclease n=1 Tax=Aquipuribacter sp. SD81 TaxID=3127703 RepID=UPI003017706A